MLNALPTVMCVTTDHLAIGVNRVTKGGATTIRRTEGEGHSDLRTRIAFNDYTSEDGVDVTPIGNDQYRLDCYPFPFTFMNEDEYEYGYDDVFEALPDADGMLRVTRLIRKSDGQNYCWTLGDKTRELRAFDDFIDELRSVGGYWEIEMGSIFRFWVPPGAEVDIDLNKRFREEPGTPQ